MIGSALLGLGLTVLQSLGCIIAGQVLVSATTVAGGLPGSVWRVNQPQVPSNARRDKQSHVSKAVFGQKGYRLPVSFYGSLFIVWYGVQLWNGAKSLQVVITALCPSFVNVGRGMSKSITGSELICVILFWLLCFVLIVRPPTVFRDSAKVAAIAVFTTFLSIVIVCTVKARGVGPLFKNSYDLVGVERVPRGAELVWTIAYGASVVMGSSSASTIPNYSRLSRGKWSYTLASVTVTLVFMTVTNLFGILATSAAVDVFLEEKKLLWAPYDLLMAFIRHGGPGARAGAFFAGIAFVLAQLRIDVMCNAFTCGIVWSTLLPRYLTRRRAALLAACIALAMNPWRLIQSSAVFTRFLGITSMLVATIDAVYLCDYFIVRRQVIQLDQLHPTRSSSIYWFYKGYNWRAFVACGLAVAYMLPGFVSYTTHSDSSIRHIYHLAWPLATSTAAMLYWTSSRVWPPLPASKVEQEVAAQPSSTTKDGIIADDDQQTSASNFDAEPKPQR